MGKYELFLYFFFFPMHLGSVSPPQAMAPAKKARTSARNAKKK